MWFDAYTHCLAEEPLSSLKSVPHNYIVRLFFFFFNKKRFLHGLKKAWLKLYIFIPHSEFETHANLALPPPLLTNPKIQACF